MPTLSQADVDQVIRLNRAVSEIDTVDELRSETLRRMEDMFRAPCSMFLLRPQGSPIATFDRYMVRGLPEVFPRSYSYRALIIDPFARTLMSQPGIELVPEVRTGSEIISYHDLMETSFYREYMHPFDIYHMLRMELVINGNSIATLGLFRPKSDPDFSTTDNVKAMLSVSAIANALGRAIQQEKYQESFSLLEKSASAVSRVGLLILDEHLTVLYCDANAQEWFGNVSDEMTGTRQSSPALPPELSALLAEYHQRLRKEVDIEKFEHTLSIFNWQRTASAQVHVRAHKTIYGRWRILVYVLPDERNLCPLNRLLNLGLTKREAEIVQLVVEGLRNYEIADRISISLNTVQSHLNKIFRKLGVSNRPELIVKVTTTADVNILRGLQ